MMFLEPSMFLYYFGIFFSLYIGVFYLLVLFENREKIQDPKVDKIREVSIVVPAFNEARTIAKTIRSLQALNYPQDKVKIIVVDDGSSDDTYGIAKTFSGITVIRKENGGKASAINVGLREVTTELVAVMDADSFVSEHALWSMVGHFKNERIMAVTPALKVYNPKGLLQGMQYVEYLFSLFFRKMFSFLDGIYVTPGPFSVYRKWFFDNYGGFQEDNMSEDLEVALRIQSHDYEIENSVNAAVYTVAPDNFPALLKQRVRWYTGVLNNLYAYRHLFSTNKGYLGVFILPVTLISILLVLSFLLWYGVMIVGGLVHNVYQTHLINFDIVGIFQDFLANFSVSNLINPMSLMGVILLAITITIFMLSRIFSGDKEKVAGSFVMYALVYGPIFSVMWLATIAHKVLNIKVKW